MAGSLFIILSSLIVICFSFPALVKNKQYNAIIIASLLLLLGNITMVLYSFDIIVLDPSKWMTNIFKPISQMIINLIQA